MTSERWGAFSVIDYKNTELLVPEVLLYDRLVIPVPSDELEKQRWSQKGWNPDLLYQRLEQLDDLAIKAPWDENRRRLFKEKMEFLKWHREDAKDVVGEVRQQNPCQMTRRILAQDQNLLREKLPKGISQVNVVAAYQSEHDFKEDYILSEDLTAEFSNLCLMIGQRLAVPTGTDHEKALVKAIKLARDEDFRRRRRKLYRWQENAITNGIKSQDAVNDLDDLIEEYNDCVKSEMRKIKYRYAFTIGGAAFAVVGGLLHDPLSTISGLISAGGSAISLGQLFTLDGRPAINAGDAEPAAMFHDVQKILGRTT
jgi:hypothetical protein